MSQFCPECGGENNDRAEFCASFSVNLATGGSTDYSRSQGTSQTARISKLTEIKASAISLIPQNPMIGIPDGIAVKDRFRIDGILREGGMGWV